MSNLGDNTLAKLNDILLLNFSSLNTFIPNISLIE
jgi:hypothetical protein